MHCLCNPLPKKEILKNENMETETSLHRRCTEGSPGINLREKVTTTGASGVKSGTIYIFLVLY